MKPLRCAIGSILCTLATVPLVGTAEQPPTPEKYAMSPLDYSTDQLPANYGGHSCRSVTKPVLALEPTKDEYETTAAYNKRVAGFGQAKIAGSTTMGDYLGIVQEDTDVRAQYNADDGILRIVTDPRPQDISIGLSSVVKSVVIASTLVSSSIRAGVEFQGEKVEIKRLNLKACALAFANQPGFGTSKVDPQETLIKMSPADARSAKGHIVVMFVGKLAPPFWSAYKGYRNATSSDLTESRFVGDALVINLSQIWIFNKVTGRIYRKIDA